MCGRFYLDLMQDELLTYFSLSSMPDQLPRYNIAPSQSIPAVVVSTEKRQMRMFRWGLIPSWAKDEKLAYRMINARAETVAEKPSFRDAFKHRRCLIPASGYFEWKADASGKQPYCIRPLDAPILVFAGLYEHWRNPQGEGVDSCTIIVTQSAPEIAAIHDRMPLCLAPEQFESWLDPKVKDVTNLKALIDTAKLPAITSYQVTRDMNNPRYQQSDAIQPIASELN